ncbi:type I methionyl aminopeptidase [Pectinatus sottacetonis]|uniref:type I methionyl aminopeptidase n=1 Tax=Pectinatus sottacetonis TaxID=1002795 RepID=UPI0018C5F880|nr:type I methionyl aminopeptidase [Pectinatus sottacetonis]
MHRNDLCWCGSGLKYKRCHLDFDEKIASIKLDPRRGQIKPPHEIIKNEKDIAGIIKSGQINNAALDLVADNIKEGMDTLTLNDMVHKFIVDNGGIPACLNYAGYPKSICISINNVVCHGIPSKDTILKDGDIVNVDITTIFDGYFADASRMFMIGNVSPEAKKLVEVTKKCMELGIEAVRPWHFVGDIGAMIQKYAHANNYSVVTALGGHGVGKKFHEEPFVNHAGEKNTGMLLVPGMVLTVEPMINIGGHDVYTDEKDGWTVYTKDGSLSAQWEKTILITQTGTQILAD